MAERTYTEKEVAVLLERAAELQALAARKAEHRPGLTLDELEAVAAEAGLDPSLLRRAAVELDQPQHALLRHNSGKTSSHVFVERRVTGALTPDLWEDVVAELRHHFESSLASMAGMAQYGTGTTEQIGRTLEWKHTSMSGIETKLMIRPREDQLDVRLSQRVGWASPPAEGTAYGLILAVMAGAIGGQLMSSPILAGVIFLVSLLAAIPLITYADSAWREKRLRELEAMADRVTAIVGTPVPESTTQAIRTSSERKAEEVAPTEESGSIDATLLEEEDDPGTVRPAPRRRSKGI